MKTHKLFSVLVLSLISLFLTINEGDVFTASGQNQPPTISNLINLLKSRNYDYDAVKTLKEMGPAAKEAIPALIKAIEDASEDGQNYFAEFTVAALVKIAPNSEEVFIALTGIIKTSEDDIVVSTTAEILVKLAQSSSEKHTKILALFKNRQGKSGNVGVEVAVLKSLYALGEKQVEPLLKKREKILALSRAMLTLQNTDRFESTYFVLSGIEDKYAVGELIHSLGREYWQAPGDAAIQLAKCDDPRVIPALVAAFGYYSRDYLWCISLHQGIETALKDRGFKTTEETLPVLIKSLEVNDYEMRRLTLRALRIIGPTAKEVLPKLKEIAEKDEDKYIRQYAKEAIVKIQKENLGTPN